MFDDEELSSIKASSFRGIARCPLGALNFTHPLVRRKHRKISQKNVQRLHGVFRKVGCLRLQEENFINAIVDDEALDNALSISEVSRDGLLLLREGQELPLLDLRVDCLSGLHRVEAAKAFLDDNDQWWTVRLFASSKRPRTAPFTKSNPQVPPSMCFQELSNYIQTSNDLLTGKFSGKYYYTVKPMMNPPRINGGRISINRNRKISVSC
jgi:hypothetical protein